MKMTPKNLTPSPDLSGLGAAELLAVIAGFQQQLALKDEALQSKEEAIQRRDAHILLLEELLRLRRIQRFAASSEKLHQLQLFDEADVEAEESHVEAKRPHWRWVLLGIRPCFWVLLHENTPFSTPILQGFPLGVAHTPLNGDTSACRPRALPSLASLVNQKVEKNATSSRCELRGT